MPYLIWTVTIVALFPASFAAYAKDIKDFDPLFASQFRFIADDGTTVELDVLIRARGNWRRNPDICKFPPLRLNFKKSQTDDTLFNKQDKLKLVTHCRNNSDRYNQAVISEYLAYRAFNVLTDYSYRVRLLKMKYVFTDRETELETYGILIEHDDRLSKRIKGEPVEVERVALSTIRSDDLNLASVFQYFVGNTDFSPKATAPDEECCHNQALFTSEDGPYYTIPYDFDQTGIVDAKHAAPNPRFGISNVRVRVYRGRCENNDHLEVTFQKFRDHRDDFEALINNQFELNSGTQDNLLEYVESFYDTIDNPKRVERRIITKCI